MLHASCFMLITIPSFPTVHTTQFYCFEIWDYRIIAPDGFRFDDECPTRRLLDGARAITAPRRGSPTPISIVLRVEMGRACWD